MKLVPGQKIWNLESQAKDEAQKLAEEKWEKEQGLGREADQL